MQRKKGKRALVEGGGPVGCGCGVLLGAAAGLFLFVRLGGVGIVLAAVLAVTCGALAWRLGDTFFEKVLSGNSDGTPIRFWWHP